MSEVLQDLVTLLKPSPLGENTFRGETQDLGFRALFGGQVMGQSLAAAMQTLPEGDWQAHSFHVYFMLAGTVTDHLEFEIDPLRNGRSFCTRQVKAIQNGRAILTMICSFQQPEDGFEHQAPMPEVKGPDGIASQVELARMFRDYFPEKVRDIYTRINPLKCG